MVAFDREESGEYLLYIAYGDSGADPAGRSLAGGARSLKSPTAWLGWRAHQSRGVGMVSPRHRKGPLPDRGYLVANGNRRHSDCAYAGGSAAEAGLRYAADSGRNPRYRRFPRLPG